MLFNAAILYQIKDVCEVCGFAQCVVYMIYMYNKMVWYNSFEFFSDITWLI